MPSLLRSGFALTLLGALVVLAVINTCQLDGIERRLLALESGAGTKRDGGGAASAVAPSRGPSDDEARALANPQNLLRANPRPLVNAATVVRGGMLRAEIGSDPRGMNPYIATGADVLEYDRYQNNRLGMRLLDDPDHFAPELALSVTTPDDGLTFVIELRRGVLWHAPTVDWASGRYAWLAGDHELTSDDFLFVFEVLQNPKVAGRVSSLRTYFDNLASVRATGRYGLEVRFTKRQATNLAKLLDLSPLPRWLYRFDEDGRPFPEASWGERLNDHWYNQRGIGTGPYVFVAWEPGVKLEWKKNERYWGEPPAFDRLQLRVVKDQASWPRLLKAGELDLVRLQPEQYRAHVLAASGPILGTEHLREARQPELGYFYLGWNAARPLFADKLVRRALTHAFDRVGLVKGVFHGLGKVTSGPFAHQQPCYDTSIEPWPYDLAAAAKLLDEAGWRDTDGDGLRDKLVGSKRQRFEFSLLLYGASTEWENVASVYREALLSIGVKLTPVAVEWSTMLKRMEERDFDVYTGAWALDWETDLMQIWHSSEADRPKSSNNVAFKHAEADRLAEALRDELDPAKRLALCRAFHRLLHEEQPYTFFFQRERPVLYWDHLNPPTFSPIWPYRDLRLLSFATRRP